MNAVRISASLPMSQRYSTEREPFLLFGQYFSNVCYTNVNYCYLPAFYPIGSACWCASPYGPASGIVR